MRHVISTGIEEFGRRGGYVVVAKRGDPYAPCHLYRHRGVWSKRRLRRSGEERRSVCAMSSLQASRETAPERNRRLRERDIDDDDPPARSLALFSGAAAPWRKLLAAPPSGAHDDASDDDSDDDDDDDDDDDGAGGDAGGDGGGGGAAWWPRGRRGTTLLLWAIWSSMA